MEVFFTKDVFALKLLRRNMPEYAVLEKNLKANNWCLANQQIDGQDHLIITAKLLALSQMQMELAVAGVVDVTDNALKMQKTAAFPVSGSKLMPRDFTINVASGRNSRRVDGAEKYGLMLSINIGAARQELLNLLGIDAISGPLASYRTPNFNVSFYFLDGQLIIVGSKAELVRLASSMHEGGLFESQAAYNDLANCLDFYNEHSRRAPYVVNDEWRAVYKSLKDSAGLKMSELEGVISADAAQAMTEEQGAVFRYTINDITMGQAMRDMQELGIDIDYGNVAEDPRIEKNLNNRSKDHVAYWQNKALDRHMSHLADLEQQAEDALAEEGRRQSRADTIQEDLEILRQERRKASEAKALALLEKIVVDEWVDAINADKASMRKNR